MRCVAGLAATSTMWAWPWASKWVSADMGKNGLGRRVARGACAANLRRIGPSYETADPPGWAYRPAVARNFDAELASSAYL